MFLEYHKCGKKIAQGGKNKVSVSLKTGRFDNIDSAVFISSVSEAVQTEFFPSVFPGFVFTP